MARLVLKFDPSLILLAWKALGKLICRLKDHTHILTGNGLSLDAMATDICEAMRSKSEECVKSASRSDKVHACTCDHHFKTGLTGFGRRGLACTTSCSKPAGSLLQ